MHFMLFSAGNDDYAIPAREVAEIVPFARLKTVPLTHPAVAGVLNFRSQPVPVLDASRLLGHHPVPALFTTRILLCRGALESAPDQLLGLAVENALEIRNLAEGDFRPPGAAGAEARFLGRICELENGRYVQWIHPTRILPTEVAAELLAGIREAA